MRIFTWTVITLGLVGCIPLGTLPSEQPVQENTFTKTLVFNDLEYESYVGNVVVNSFNPFVKLGNPGTMRVELDLLTNRFENIQIKYIHCDADWTKSRLTDLQFLNDFNRFDHSSFDYSINTKTPYVTYFFDLKRPYLSGNYLVVIHRRGNENDILATRRVVFYEQEVGLLPNVRTPTAVSIRRTHQQIDLELNYSSLDVTIPMENFQTVVFQNKNWWTKKSNVRPTNLLTNSNTLEWKYNTDDMSFPGWNQFRWLDLRTLSVRGQGVARIDRLDDQFDVYQGIETDIYANSYREIINDNNGRYIPGNSDPGESWLEADYANVTFTLKSENNLGDVYVMGRFNNWQKQDMNRMDYFPEEEYYKTTIRLKQGFYDYRYELESEILPAYEFEGSHFQAENEYDVLVYYRTPGMNYDRVVGYTSINSRDYY
jgi:hypothetical protein